MYVRARCRTSGEVECSYNNNNGACAVGTSMEELPIECYVTKWLYLSHGYMVIWLCITKQDNVLHHIANARQISSGDSVIIKSEVRVTLSSRWDPQ